MTRKNILFIIPGLKGGGAEKVVASLSLDLIKNNNVFIALFNTSYGIGYPYGGEIINLDAPASHNSASNSVFLRVYRFFYLIAKLKKIKKQHAIDISISFLDNSNMVNLFSKNAGKTIISVRTFTSTYHSHMGWYGKSYSMLMRRFFHRADHIVVPSEGILEDLVDKYQVESSKISVINNSFTIAQIQSLSAEPVSEAYLSIFKSPVLIQVGI
jgi:glycosyltransferase involved in cell wall biosynthesis